MTTEINPDILAESTVAHFSIPSHRRGREGQATALLVALRYDIDTAPANGIDDVEIVERVENLIDTHPFSATRRVRSISR
jgi:hypothetical protein